MIQALHNRRLVIQSCRPNSFAFRADQADIIRFTEISPLPGFNLATNLSGTPFESSSLFLRQPMDASSGPLSDSFIRKNLRYLAPEVASSRRPSALGDIFSFGVMAYEVVTGSTLDGGPDSPEAADIDLLIDIHRHLTIDITPPDEHLRREAALGGFKPALPPSQLSDIIMRCLQKNVDERYSSLDGLSYDLAKLAQICTSRGDLDRFAIGEVDQLSKFTLPRTPIHRKAELDALDRALATVCGTPSQNNSPHLVTRVLNLWAPSGSGKTRLVHHWAQKVEFSNQGKDCLIGYAKMDEHSQKPLSSFVQIFQSLLDRVLTDPKEDVKVWNKSIRDTLGNQYPFFLSLLSNEVRSLVTMGIHARPAEAIDVSGNHERC